MLGVNRQYLDHDTLTDIITFDYTTGKTVSADIFISLERVADNAKVFKVAYDQEQARVIAHGVLHCMGFMDKSQNDKIAMRQAEDIAIQMIDSQ